MQKVPVALSTGECKIYPPPMKHMLPENGLTNTEKVDLRARDSILTMSLAHLETGKLKI